MPRHSSGVDCVCLTCGKNFRALKKAMKRGGGKYCCHKCYTNRPQPLSERLWKHVVKGPGEKACWLWTGKLHKDGYGVIKGGAGQPDTLLTHRASWEIHFGPIPEGLGVLHSCDTPACVRPDHLFLGTGADNNADKMAKERQARGEDIWSAILTEDDVLWVRQQLANGIQQVHIAAILGVSPECISGIATGRHWKHVQ